MTRQVIPLEGIDKAGFISDMPAATLPPGAWSDVKNVRFKDGAIRKMKGETSIFETAFMNATNANDVTINVTANIRHIVYWENPNERQYVVINRELDNSNVLVDLPYTVILDDLVPGGARAIRRLSLSAGYLTSDTWQSTQFNGGFSIIVNGGLETPQHLTAITGVPLAATAFVDLPGWESYIIPAADSPTGSEVTASSVTAGIVTAYGNLLIAGDLEERESDGTLIRKLNGLVRSSDVAAPGTIPQNWNPFAAGVGTADEIQIADTGNITAILPLRGNVFVYTSDTVNQVRVSGAGLATSIVTTEYGALGQDTVFEFKGQHFIIGSDDIYIFSGNPGDIKSVADGRVRRFFYDNLSAAFYDRPQIIRDQLFDELWICYPNLNSSAGELNEALIWNYVNNTWTKRDLPDIRSVTTGPVPGGGQPTTLIKVGDDAAEAVGDYQTERASIATVTFQDDTVEFITAGVQDVQSFQGTSGAIVSTVGTVESDSVILRIPNNFQPIGGTYSFDPDNNNTYYDTEIVNQAITATNTGSVQAVAVEIATGIHDFTFNPVTGAGGTVVDIVNYDATDPSLYLTVDADMPPTFDVVVSFGEGPIGAFDSLVYTGQNFALGDRVIETGVDLANNEGMVFVASETNNANTYLYDTINGPNMRFRIDESNNAIVMQNDGLDAFQTDGWLLDAGSNQVDGLNMEGLDYLSWTMQTGADFFDVVEYTGGPNSLPAGITEVTGGNSITGSGSRASSTATNVAMVLIGGSGATADAIGSVGASGSQAGSLIWMNLNLEAGETLTMVQGAAGVGVVGSGGNAIGNPGGASTATVSISGVGTLIASAPGGGGGAVLSRGPTTDAGDFVALTTFAGYISHGGGLGGLGGLGGGSLNNGGGGGTGGYGGTEGDSYAGGAGGFGGAGGGAGGQANDGLAGVGGAAGGGASNPNASGFSGGSVEVYGVGESGAASSVGGNPGSGGRAGSTSAVIPGGGQAGQAGAGAVGAARLLAGPGGAYAGTPGATTNVENFLVHKEAHALTSAPGMMWFKARDSAQVWTVWHRDLALEPNQNNDSYIQLSGQNETVVGNGDNFDNTRPTTTQFTVGNAAGGGDGRTNGTNATYLNYLFGSNELTTSNNPLLNGNDPDPNGNVYCGSYTSGTVVPGGTIGGIGFFVELGWKPSVMLTKNTGDSQPWSIHFSDPDGFDDTATFGSRFGFPHTSTPWAPLLRFVDVGEPDGVGGIATVAGFTVRSTSDEVNPGGFEDSVIFMAIRELVPPALPTSLVSDEPVFTGTGAAGLEVNTGVDVRGSGSGTGANGLVFFGAGGFGGANSVTPNVLNSFGTLTQSGGGAASGNRERLPAFNTDVVVFGGSSLQDVYATFQDDGFTLTSNTTINLSGVPLQAFSFTDSPGFFSTTLFTTISVASPFPPFTISHTLGQVPQMVMIKTLTRAEDRAGSNPTFYRWNVWHNTTGNDVRLSTSLDSADPGVSQSGWLVPNGTTGMDIPTSDSTLWTSTNADVNVMYAFGGKDVDGVAASVVVADDGTLAAGGGIQENAGNVVNLGWKPGFIMIKGITDSTGDSTNWRYWSVRDNYANVRRWNVANALESNSDLTVTDNGFTVANLTTNGTYIYWCSRDNLIDPGSLPEFSLNNFIGTEAAVDTTAFANASDLAGATTALIDGINAIPTDPMNWTATSTGSGTLTVAADIYGHRSAGTFQLETDLVTDGRITVDGASTGTQFHDGTPGSTEFEVNLGTPSDMSNPAVLESFIATAGTGFLGDFLAIVDDEHTIAGNGSSYNISHNDVAGILQHVTGVQDTINGVLNALKTIIEAATSDYTIVVTGDSMVITDNFRGASSPWTLIPRHPIDTTDGTGTLTFNGATLVTDGAAMTSEAAGTTGTGAVTGVDDLLANYVVNVTLPTTVASDGVVTSQNQASTTFLPPGPPADQPIPTRAPVTGTTIAAELVTNSPFTNHTPTSAGPILTLTNNTLGYTEAAVAATGYAATQHEVDQPDLDPGPTVITTQEGFVTTVPAMYALTDSENTQADSTVVQLTGVIASAIATEIATHLTLFEQYEISIEPDNITVEVLHNQFGPAHSLPVGPLDVLYTDATTYNITGDVVRFEINATLQDITEDFTAADPERPWPADILNEARTFIVSGGGTDIDAMDIGYDFNDVAYESFVERRNFQLEPLIDTETMTGIFMHTSGGGTVTKVDGVVTDNTTTNLQISLAQEDNSFEGLVAVYDTTIYPLTFNVGIDYKIDTRINGRMLNMKYSDTSADFNTVVDWTIDSLGVAVGKGGTR